MREAREVFFVDGVRTPFGKAGPKGQYWRTRADDMGVKAVRELLRRNPEIPPERIGDVVLAATAQVGDQGLTLGRDVALLAGIPALRARASRSTACAQARSPPSRPLRARSRSARSTSRSRAASSTWGITRWATTSTSIRASSRSG